MVFHQRKVNAYSSLAASIALTGFMYFILIHKGKSIVDFIIGTAGIILFGSMVFIVLYRIIIGYKQQAYELIIDELGIRLKAKNDKCVSWKDIESIRVIYLALGKIPLLSIRVTEIVKESIDKDRKYKWLYYPDKWLGADDINIYFNVFDPSIEHAIKEIRKYFNGPILGDKYIF